MKIATWNINSVRLRAELVKEFLDEASPDILCLQETKSPVEKLPLNVFEPFGYTHHIARGLKGYNGVMILSRLPFTDSFAHDYCGREDARHVAARFENGVTVQNFYVPAGGDEADRDVNEKFGHKLDFLTEMRDRFGENNPKKSVLVGDLNIAPLEDDVWSHKQLLKVVSHTPIEVEHLDAVMKAGNWVDVWREKHPEGKLYSWWSYRSREWEVSNRGRRLDHIWTTADLSSSVQTVDHFKPYRGATQPSDHIPVMVTLK